MDVVSTNYLPGDPRLIDQIVYDLKSQGIFDQFRKECIADVDTKPAYQNLSQRVEGSVMNFLNKQTFTESLNKNQLREQLRKNITESGFLESGVERIVDQVVNPKINTVFLPKVEDVVYRFLGLERPNHEDQKHKTQDGIKPKVEDLLPNDLEAVSPESVNNDQLCNSRVAKKEESFEETCDNSLNSSNPKTEDESPAFEPLEENTKYSMPEENSVDSHLSGISGLGSHESTQNNDMQSSDQMDISQDVSQCSIKSEGNFSIITTDNDTKMEVSEDTVMSEKSDKLEIRTEKTNDQSKENNQLENKMYDDVKTNSPNDLVSENTEAKTEVPNNVVEINADKDVDSKKTEEKKQDNDKHESKRSRDKHKSSRSDRDRKDDKRSRSKSQSKSKDQKDKSSSKHSSSSKEKDKKEISHGKEENSEKDKITKKEDKERDKSKDKSSSRTKDSKSDKSRDRSEKNGTDKEKDKEKDKDRRDKEKSGKERSNKERSDKEKSEKEKEKPDTDKHKSCKDNDKKSDKDKPEKDRSNSSKHSKEKSSSSKKDNKEKDKREDKSTKDKSLTNKDRTTPSDKYKDSSSKDKDSSKNTKTKDKSSSSSSKDKGKDKKGEDDSKTKSSDKHKKSDRDKPSSHAKGSSSKKEREKKVTDDHYSLKDKKSDRRSTDRDSNDGSSKMSRNSSFTESFSNSHKESGKESSEVFSSGGGDSSNSDKIEAKVPEDKKEPGGVELHHEEAAPPIKYNKPKFASNIHEAMKIMKIRKQLAKLERQNQLALANVPAVNENIQEIKEIVKAATKPSSPVKLDQANMERGMIIQADVNSNTSTHTVSKPSPLKTNGDILLELQVRLERHAEAKFSAKDDLPLLKSQDLSMESFKALEARLAQEMANINEHLYGDDEDDDSYDYSSVRVSPVKKRKKLDDSRTASHDNAAEDTDADLQIVENDDSVQFVSDFILIPSGEENNSKNADGKILKGLLTQTKALETTEHIEMQINQSNSAGSVILEELLTNSEDVKAAKATSTQTKDSAVGILDQFEHISEATSSEPDKGSGGILKGLLAGPGTLEASEKTTLSKKIVFSDFSGDTNDEIELVVGEQVHSTAEIEKAAYSSVDSNTTIYRQIISEADDFNSTGNETIPQKDSMTENNLKKCLGFTSLGSDLVVDHTDDSNSIETESERSKEPLDGIDGAANEINLVISRNSEASDNLDRNIKTADVNNQSDSMGTENESQKEVVECVMEDSVLDIPEDIPNQFRGFTSIERSSSSLEHISQLIEKISQDIDKQSSRQMSLQKVKASEDQPKEENSRSTPGSPARKIQINAAMLEDGFKKNGKKLFIKIDRLHIELTSKVLVKLQEMGLDEVFGKQSGDTIEVVNSTREEGSNGTKNSHLCDVKASEQETKEDVIRSFVERVLLERRERDESPTERVTIDLATNDNIKDTHKSILKKGSAKKREGEESLIVKWEDKDSPCYYFDKSDSVSKNHLAVLNSYIGRLENSIEQQSLKLQNNIPEPKKGGRKRKAGSTENNNSIGCDYKPERKRRLLSDANSNQNVDSLCNTDVSAQQSFSLPLSPADSDKSAEQTKNEPVTVRTKRNGRSSTAKRYSSEDLYKPRPILGGSSSRRRTGRLSDNRS